MITEINDHKGPIYPRTKNGNLHITSIIDRFSGKVWDYPVPNTDVTTTCVTIVQHMAEHGAAESLVSDLGGDFMSEVIKLVCNMAGIKKMHTSGNYPQTNGTTERWNRTMSAGLRGVALENGVNFTEDDNYWDIM